MVLRPWRRFFCARFSSTLAPKAPLAPWHPGTLAPKAPVAPKAPWHPRHPGTQGTLPLGLILFLILSIPSMISATLGGFGSRRLSSQPNEGA